MPTNPTLKLFFASLTRTTALLQISAPVLLIVFAVAFQINSLDESREQQLARTRLNAQDLGATLAASIVGAFKTIDITLLSATDYVRNQSASRSPNEHRLDAVFNQLQRRVPSLILLRATNQNGDVISDSANDSEAKLNIADRQYFQQLKNDPHAGMVISEPIIGKSTKKWVMVCARRFNRADGQFGGVVFGAIELDGFTEKLSGREMKLSDNDAFVLRNDQSNIMIRYARGHQDMQMNGKKVTSPPIVAFDKSLASSTSYVANSALDNVQRLFYLQRVGDLPMSIIVGLSIDDALAGWRSDAQRKWMITAMFILVVLISFFLIHLEQVRKLAVIRDLKKTSDDLTQLILFNEAIFLNSPLPIGVYASEGQCINVNEALANLLGTSRDVLLCQNLHHIASWKNTGLLDACLSAAGNQTCSECEINLVTDFGKQVSATCHILSIQQNQEKLLLIQFVDMTEIRHINSKLENILKSMNEGVHVINDQGIIVMENDASIQMLGWQGDDMLGKPAHITMHHHHADRSFYAQQDCPIYATLHDGLVRHVDDDVFWRKDGTFFPVEYTATPILNPDGEGNAVTVVFRDITYRKQLEDELRRQATHDVLTGLPNRRLLMDRLGQAININRRQNTHGALLFLDLDKFKDMNDTFGHEAGDHLLIEVARRLKQVIRESDSVARLGGDEFVVLLLGLDAEYDLAKKYVDIVAEKISRKLREDYLIDGTVHQGSASIGIKIFYNAELPEKILRDADAAMYEMKKIHD